MAIDPDLDPILDELRARITALEENPAADLSSILARLTKLEAGQAPAAVTPPAPPPSAQQYNADDGRGHTGDMLVRDIAYYPSGFTMPPVAN